MRLYSFPPVADTTTRVLIIGSMPGAASLAAQEYYAYKYNQFWPLLFAILEQGRTPADYSDKLQILLKHHIGLWDALRSCCRQGSSDASIRKEQPNDFKGLLTRFPQIRTLLFNGKTAYNCFQRAFKNNTFTQRRILLPSTSPAYANMPFETKKEIWQKTLLENLH